MRWNLYWNPQKKFDVSNWNLSRRNAKPRQDFYRKQNLDGSSSSDSMSVWKWLKYLATPCPNKVNPGNSGSAASTRRRSRRFWRRWVAGVDFTRFDNNELRSSCISWRTVIFHGSRKVCSFDWEKRRILLEERNSLSQNSNEEKVWHLERARDGKPHYSVASRRMLCLKAIFFENKSQKGTGKYKESALFSQSQSKRKMQEGCKIPACVGVGVAPSVLLPFPRSFSVVLK